MTITQQNRYLERPAPSSLADVIDTILDKGLVIDIYVRVSLVGIELLTIDARIVIASVDTYLRFAEAVNRLDLTETQTHGIPELVQGVTESGAKGKTAGAIEGAKEKLGSILPGSDDEDSDKDADEEKDEGRKQPARRTRKSTSRQTKEKED
ncbi:gas vesicle protein GvpJ [Nocardioides sp. NPDC087217]|uniref:gas vesicle protein GvpJ n=1 Tax=Nocardioides sp. NPDC087217 TaxID=3364335 RepID=UPI0038092BA0